MTVLNPTAHSQRTALFRQRERKPLAIQGINSYIPQNGECPMLTFSMEPEGRAMARGLYETEWISLNEIARRSGVSARSLGRYIETEGWLRPGHGRVVDMQGRLRLQAEKLLGIIEANVAAPTAERLRDMAALTKILRDISALDEETGAPADDGPDPAVLRALLRTRLEALDLDDQRQLIGVDPA